MYDDHEHTPSNSKTKACHGPKLPPLSSTSDIQEYSWEWGAFPTLSPMRTTFGKGGRLDGGVPWKGINRHSDELLQSEMLGNDMDLSAGCRLSAKDGNDKVFIVTCESQSPSFESSLVSQHSSDVKGKGKEVPSVGYDEISTRFEEGKVSFSKFMHDDDIVHNPTLVIKWVDGQYLTRHNHPTFFRALAIWRTNTLYPHNEGEAGEEETKNEVHHSRSKSEPPTPEQRATAEIEIDQGEHDSEQKPASLSWAQWWSRSRRRDTEAAGGIPPGERPVLRSAASAPLPAGVVSCSFFLVGSSSSDLKRGV
jgi:phosphatidate phosphatase LPIN